ncbi:MAG: hypothetical protein NXY59_00715 [Aigarchaeota archaeon]|nr:hypothetical protein [Candidatus Pelearchaeum maunauluense]
MGPRWLVIEVIDVYPTTLGHCPHFNLVTHELGAAGAEFCPLSDQVVEYPRHVIESHYRVAGLVKRLKTLLRGLPLNVQVRMIEATSAVGLWKCLRHRVRSQSAILVNGRKICDGDYSLDEAAESIRREALRILGEGR